MSVQTKVFVDLFHNYYSDMMGSEYKGSEDKELLKMTCKTLKRNKHSIVEYLIWFFKVIRSQNVVLTIHLACDSEYIDKFLLENRPRR